MESFDGFDDALARVNDSDFGLQAGVFTGRLAHAMRAWDRLEVGGVVVGDVPSFRADNMPYGGIKDSGIGAAGVVNPIDDMTQQPVLVIPDPCPRSELPALPQRGTLNYPQNRHHAPLHHP